MLFVGVDSINSFTVFFDLFFPENFFHKLFLFLFLAFLSGLLCQFFLILLFHEDVFSLLSALTFIFFEFFFVKSLSLNELFSSGSVFKNLFLLLSFQLISEYLVFVLEDSAFFLFLDFLLLSFLEDKLFLEFMLLSFSFVVPSFLIFNLFKILLFLLLFGPECFELRYVVFLVFYLLLFAGDFFLNEVSAFFLLHVLYAFHFGLLLLLDSFFGLLDFHEKFSLFLQFFLCFLELDFSLFFFVKLLSESPLILCLEVFLTPCLLDFCLFLLLCFHKVVDFGLSDHIIFQYVTVLAVLFLLSFLFHLKLFLHFLFFDVGFLLLNGQFLNLELLPFDLGSDFIHEFFLLEFVFDLLNLDVCSASCGTVVGSLEWVKTFCDKFVSLFNKQVEFLFSSFFIVLEFDFKTFFIIHAIVVDFFHILKFFNEELFGFDALATTCFETSGTFKERFKSCPLIEIF